MMSASSPTPRKGRAASSMTSQLQGLPPAITSVAIRDHELEDSPQGT